MLLIGSRAAALRLSPFREPSDWDLVATPEEVAALGLGGPHPKVRRGPDVAELEVAISGSSSEALMQHFEGTIMTPFGPADVASLDALYVVKRSHLWFRHRWIKHFRDHAVLREAGASVPLELEAVLAARVEETKRRVGHRDRDFSVSNDEFFRRSAKRVERHVVHDDIHEVVKLGPVPAFRLLKDDPGSAAVSFDRFDALPFRTKVENMQEECMVLVIERHAIPARVAGRGFSEARAVESILREMCYNYLPFDFRMFCVDHFETVRDRMPRGFAARAMDALGVVGPSIVR